MILPLALSALAAATPANADLTALYDSICAGRGEPGGDFRPVTSSEIPADLREMYIGPQEGRYWRREGERPAFVALTRGPGHWGGVEEYCVVGARGASFGATVRAFSGRLHDRSMFRGRALQTWERWGLINVTLSGHDASVLVTQRPEGWVSLGTGGQVTAATTRWPPERREVNVDPR